MLTEFPYFFRGYLEKGRAMPIMTWDDSLDIGVDAMNEEHQGILAKMNEIYDSHAAGQTGPAINLLIDQLGKICVEHFASEEKFMQDTGYPGYDRHKLQHEKLLERYSDFAQNIQAAGGVAGDDFFNFLKFWLASHIRGIDIKYGEHANAQRAA